MEARSKFQTAVLVAWACCIPVVVYLGIALFVNYQVGRLTPTKLRDCDEACSCCIRCGCQAEKRRVVESPSDQTTVVCPCRSSMCWCRPICECASRKEACSPECPCKLKPEAVEVGS